MLVLCRVVFSFVFVLCCVELSCVVLCCVVLCCVVLCCVVLYGGSGSGGGGGSGQRSEVQSVVQGATPPYTLHTTASLALPYLTSYLT